MAALSQGIVGGEMAWPLVLVGIAMGITLILVRVKSPMLFSVGMYLPLETTFAIFIGGLIRGFVDKLAGKRDYNAAQKARVENAGVLAASGLIAGEALVGLLVAGVVAFRSDNTFPTIAAFAPIAPWLAIPVVAAPRGLPDLRPARQGGRGRRAGPADGDHVASGINPFRSKAAAKAAAFVLPGPGNTRRPEWKASTVPAELGAPGVHSCIVENNTRMHAWHDRGWGTVGLAGPASCETPADERTRRNRSAAGPPAVRPVPSRADEARKGLLVFFAARRARERRLPGTPPPVGEADRREPVARLRPDVDAGGRLDRLPARLPGGVPGRLVPDRGRGGVEGDRLRLAPAAGLRVRRLRARVGDGARELRGPGARGRRALGARAAGALRDRSSASR